jgi:hypothetical protein
MHFFGHVEHGEIERDQKKAKKSATGFVRQHMGAYRARGACAWDAKRDGLKWQLGIVRADFQHSFS